MDWVDPFGEKMPGSRNRDTKMRGVIGLIEAGSNRISGRAELTLFSSAAEWPLENQIQVQKHYPHLLQAPLSPKRYQEDWLQYAVRLDFSRKQRRMHAHVSKAKARLRHVDKAGLRLSCWVQDAGLPCMSMV